VVIVVAVIFQI